jgi:hypothetical protein
MVEQVAVMAAAVNTGAVAPVVAAPVAARAEAEQQAVGTV